MIKYIKKKSNVFHQDLQKCEESEIYEQIIFILVWILIYTKCVYINLLTAELQNFCRTFAILPWQVKYRWLFHFKGGLNPSNDHILSCIHRSNKPIELDSVELHPASFYLHKVLAKPYADSHTKTIQGPVYLTKVPFCI